jgi:arylsulfatase A-like enzyme
MKVASVLVLGLLLSAGCSGSDSGDTEVTTTSTVPTGSTNTETQVTTTTHTPVPIDINGALKLTDGRPTNLLVISIDTLRRDHINAFGYTRRETTPTIDQMITGGVGLYNHRSCSSWTLPSFLCFLTGKNQISMGHWPPNNDGLPPATPDEITLMAEYFSDKGFYTMLTGASGFLGTSTNTNQGYDEGVSVFEPVAAEVVTDAISLLENRPSYLPFMMHMHLIDPHMPYSPADAYLKELKEVGEIAYDLNTDVGTLQLWQQYGGLGEKARNITMQHLEIRYDGEIRTVNDQIERLFSVASLEEVWEETLVVLVADHGEEFFEHENFNHGYNAFSEITDGVAALYWPGRLTPVKVTAPTLHQDLLPTIFSVFGFEPEPLFTGLVVGDAERDHYFNLTYRVEKTHQSVSDGHTKLMYRWDDDELLGGPKYFYDLAIDPGEQDNIYDPKDKRVIEMWDLLLPEVERLSSQEKGATPLNPGP